MGTNVLKLNDRLPFTRKPVNINVSGLLPHGLKLNKGLLFARKLANINVSRSAAPTLAAVPASRYKCHKK